MILPDKIRPVMTVRYFGCLVVLAAAILFVAVPAMGAARMTLVYDNTPYQEGLTADYGFSCLVEAAGKRILFDTGRDRTILLSNMKALGIEVQRLDAVVISHLHMDHAGGLMLLLDLNPKLTVFLPDATPDMLQEIRRRGVKYVITDRPVQIAKGLFLTGPLGTGVREQALLINSASGVIVVAGCSHPGIIDVITKSKEITKRPVHLVLGGFHTMPETLDGMSGVIQQFKTMGVRNVAPAHCTDPGVKAFFKAGYGKNYISVGVGKTINIKK